MRKAGARLVSITEPMIGEDTPESFYMEGMFALNNQYESMKTGRNVKSGQYQKAKAGGTYGGYRLGYIKAVEQLPDGRQVSGVVHDPKRADLITAAFRLYASGEYSLSQLVDELYDFGLRSAPTRRFAEGKVGTSALQRLLRNPYYAGKIVYGRGTADEEVFEGRHEALIDQETFERVQRLLDEKRVAGVIFDQEHFRGLHWSNDNGIIINRFDVSVLGADVNLRVQPIARLQHPLRHFTGQG